MKRVTSALMFVAGVILFGAPALADWHVVGTNRAGKWAVNDDLIADTGHCKTVMLALELHRPQHKSMGTVVVKHYQVFRYLDQKRQIIHTNKTRLPVRSVTPRTILDWTLQRVCLSGFGAKSR